MLEGKTKGKRRKAPSNARATVRQTPRQTVRPLAGKTVWIVEPERFSSHALEAALADMGPEAIVPLGSLDEARTRLERVGPRGAPAVAVVDFTGHGDAAALARNLAARGATVVRTVPPNGMGGGTDGGTGERMGERMGGASADAANAAANAAGKGLTPDVPRPYAPADVTRAIARHYGLLG